MGEKITPTQLRKDLYRLLDRIVETGEPLQIDRNGVTLQIERKPALSKLERIRAMGRPDVWVGDRNDIFHLDLMEEWREEWGVSKEEMEVKG
jgi:hypothetical protein